MTGGLVAAIIAVPSRANRVYRYRGCTLWLSPTANCGPCLTMWSWCVPNLEECRYIKCLECCGANGQVKYSAVIDTDLCPPGCDCPPGREVKPCSFFNNDNQCNTKPNGGGGGPEVPPIGPPVDGEGVGCTDPMTGNWFPWREPGDGCDNRSPSKELPVDSR